MFPVDSKRVACWGTERGDGGRGACWNAASVCLTFVASVAEKLMAFVGAEVRVLTASVCLLSHSSDGKYIHTSTIWRHITWHFRFSQLGLMFVTWYVKKNKLCCRLPPCCKVVVKVGLLFPHETENVLLPGLCLTVFWKYLHVRQADMIVS